MAIGKIDCTVEKTLCNEFGVRGYPTLKYSVDGDVVDYPGGRDEAAILAFATKLSGPAVTVVNSYDEALHFASTQTDEGVAFLGYDPRSSENAPTEFHQVFNRVARLQRVSAHFVWLNPGQEERSYQFIHKIEPTVQPRSYETKETDITTINVDSFGAWVKEHNVPLVSELGPNNFHRIGRNGRPLVISVVDFNDAKQKAAVKDHLTDYAKQLTDEEADKYYYGIMDGKRWGKFLGQFDVVDSENPQTIVLEVPTKTYWQNSTYKNTLEFMKAVETGEIKSQTAKKNPKEGILGKIEYLFVENFPYSAIILLVLVLGIIWLIVPAGDDLRPPYDRVPEESGEVLGKDEADDHTAEDEPKKEK